MGYDRLEAYLKHFDTPYLVGNNVTLADLSCIANVSSLTSLFPTPEDKYPKINAWVKKMEELPYYFEVNKKFAELFQKSYRQILAKNREAK